MILKHFRLFFLNFFDQILNVLTISIFQVYYSKFFSSKANDSRLSTDIDIGEEVSDIGGAYKANMSISVTGDQLADTKSKIGDNTATFEIRKNMEKDEEEIMFELQERILTEYGIKR